VRPGVSGGTYSTSWVVRRYLTYVLVPQEVLEVPIGVSEGTQSTSWCLRREVL
jgi:hypothetical protein